MNNQLNADCSRCNQQKEKVFRIEANPSVAWGATEVQEMPPAVYSCKECLTDDEIAVLLAPAALFTVETLFKHRLPDISSVAAVLRHRGREVSGERESALALL